jgi:ATP-dependent RNA helicase DeaD
MDTFEEVGLAPELVESLIAEGIERPTTLQAEAMPVLMKGNSALVRGGSGAGVLVTYGAPLLDRIEPGGSSPRGLVMVADRSHAVRLARALARLGTSLGHRVAAIGGPFALPEHADILFATPEDLVSPASADRVVLDGIEVWVIDGATALMGDESARKAVEMVLERLPAGQGVVLADPVTEKVSDLVERRLPRAVHIPSDAARPDTEGAPVERGRLRVHAAEDTPGDVLPSLVDTLLQEDGVRHLLLFFRGEDQAADGGDLLTLHGFHAGAPGDPDVPVWLAVDAMEARQAIREAGVGESVLALSVGAPADVDELDRRHGGSRDGGVILAPTRQQPHLRRLAGEAGYRVEWISEEFSVAEAAVRQLEAEIADAIANADLAPSHMMLERVVREHGAAQVAAALTWLLRSGRVAPDASAPTAFVRLFLSIGSRDGVSPGDLLGAITGEAEIDGERVGRIDIRDTFSKVDVDEKVAGRVIEALNGISVRGRSVRADYDRGGPRPQSRRPKR